jgi:hypothetical protein
MNFNLISRRISTQQQQQQQLIKMSAEEIVRFKPKKKKVVVVERDDEDVVIGDLVAKPKDDTVVVVAAEDCRVKNLGDARLFVRSERGAKGAVSCCGSANKNELRAWCRKWYGKDWWKSPDKKAMLAEAKEAIKKVVIADMVVEK